MDILNVTRRKLNKRISVVQKNREGDEIMDALREKGY
jgi:hypothetical protein